MSIDFVAFETQDFIAITLTIHNDRRDQDKPIDDYWQHTWISLCAMVRFDHTKVCQD